MHKYVCFSNIIPNGQLCPFEPCHFVDIGPTYSRIYNANFSGTFRGGNES